MSKLIPLPIHEPWQVERMRQIFNENLDQLATRPLTAQSEKGQQKWWSDLNHHTRVKAYLYAPTERPWKFIAFSLLQQKGDFWTPLFAIERAEWGKGYGREIIQHYLAVAEGQLAGSQIRTNAAIVHLNERAGWIKVGYRVDTDSDLLWHPGPADAPRQEEIYQEILHYHGIA